MLANRYVAGAAPDGYTLLLVTGAYRAQAAVLKELSFDPLKDISMISLLMEYPFVLVARPDAPYKSVKELIAYAKRSAIQLNYASSGAGSVHHLTSELFNAMTGIELSPLTDARELWLCPFSTPMNRIYIYGLSNPISSGKIAIVKAIVASCQFRRSVSRNASDQALSRRAKD